MLEVKKVVIMCTSIPRARNSCTLYIIESLINFEHHKSCQRCWWWWQPIAFKYRLKTEIKWPKLISQCITIPSKCPHGITNDTNEEVRISIKHSALVTFLIHSMSSLLVVGDHFNIWGGNRLDLPLLWRAGPGQELQLGIPRGPFRWLSQSRSDHVFVLILCASY